MIDMKVLLLGTYQKNAGPDNVNRALLSERDDRLLYLHAGNKYTRFAETVITLKKCDVVLVSGICSLKYLNLMKLYKKPYVYLMHGDLEYENEVNHLNIRADILQTQTTVLSNASKIICVSEKYAEWVGKRYPQYKSKITYVNNGVNICKRNRVIKEPYSIAVAGGNTPVKANQYVCEAVNILNKQGKKCKLHVFGIRNSECEDLPRVPEMRYMGQLDISEYYDLLDRISVFVMNSDVESFGLTAADAINCNCSLLMSENIGASSIFNTCEEDMIHNNHDPEEIARKIECLEKHPNTDRLYDSLDKDKVCVGASYKALMSICEEIIK